MITNTEELADKILDHLDLLKDREEIRENLVYLINQTAKTASGEEAMDVLLGDGYPKWRGYDVMWCDHCGTYIICCKDPECHGSSCNGGGCDKCHQDHLDFLKLKHRPEQFLSESEKAACQKRWWLKKYMKECFKLGVEPIDWRALHEKGCLCDAAYDIFSQELKEFHEEHEKEKAVRLEKYK